jgi:hypothetical protein
VTQMAFSEHHDMINAFLEPARCQRITVSGRTIASVSYILGNSRLPQHQNLRLEHCARPQQIDHCPNDQFAQIKHRAAASPDSRSTATGLDLR